MHGGECSTAEPSRQVYEVLGVARHVDELQTQDALERVEDGDVSVGSEGRGCSRRERPQQVLESPHSDYLQQT
jgi:hypothetical protein